MGKRIIATDAMEEDIRLEGNLRPQTLEEYIGQEKLKRTLKIYIQAAKEAPRPAGPCAFLRAAGAGKDYAGRDHCQ